MSRPSRGNIFLTFEEHKWAHEAVARRIENAELLKSDRERDIVRGMANKLEALMSPLRDPMLLKASRNEARYLQKVAQEVHNRLVLVVIPGYAERMAEDVKRYGSYLKRAQEKAQMLNDIINKVKAAL